MEKNSRETLAETFTTQNKGIDDTSDYSIYCYMKEHPAAFLGVASACVAGATAFINFLMHLYLVMAYRGWNIPPVLFNQDRWSYLYYFFISLLIYCVSACFARELFDKYYIKWYRDSNRIDSLLIWYRTVLLKEEIRGQHHILKTIKNEENYDKEAVDEITIRIASIRKRLFALERDLISIRISFFLLNVILAIGASLGLLLPIIMIVMSVGQWSIKGILLLWLFSFIGYTISAPIFAKIVYPAYSGKSIKKFVKDKYGSATYDEDRKTLLTQYVDDRGEKASKFYSNEGLKRAGILAAIGFVSLLFGTMAMALLPSQGKTLATYVENDELYVVAYYTGSTYVLEEAIIVDDALYVNTDEQRIISNDSDMRFTYMSFENIVLLSERNGSDKTMSEPEAPIV